jgi:hypothetical protein
MFITSHSTRVEAHGFTKCIAQVKLLHDQLQNQHTQSLAISSNLGKHLEKLQKICKSKNIRFPIFCNDYLNLTFSYCYKHIRLHKLICAYPKLAQCTVSTDFIIKNLKELETSLKDDPFWNSVQVISPVPINVSTPSSSILGSP